MKVIILADPFSAHVIKWANGLHSKGLEVMVFGLSEFDASQYHPEIKVEIFEIPQFIKWQNDGNFLKALYLAALPKLKKTIKKFNCDILHAHSASSYGLLGALTGFNPFIISVWGNDVYNFPQKNKIYANLIRYNLSKANVVLSTSKIMAAETSKYTSKKIFITPFGINTELFRPKSVKSIFDKNDIVIGTIKSLEKKYGSELLLTAFREIKKKYPSIPLKLLLVGRGSLEIRLRELVNEYGLAESVKITGFIPFSQVSDYHNMLSIYAAPSTEESETFGVAILEASSCEKPVVVSNIGGLPEVVVNNETGIIIQHNNLDELINALDKLVSNSELARKFGKNGRKFVQENYNWDTNLNDIITIYNGILEEGNAK